eukprot:gene17869-27533_t
MLSTGALIVWLGALILLHALFTAIQHHSDTDTHNPVITAEALLGFVLATTAYMHKTRFEPILRKSYMEQRSLESFCTTPDFMTFNHRGK